MKCTVLAFAALLACSPPLLAQIPNVRAPATCVRSLSVLLCADRRGNYYSVAQLGNTLSTRGFDAASGQHWTQTTSRYGAFAFFSGITSKGQVWVGSNRKLGWNLNTRMASSSGERLKWVCNRLTACQ